MQKILFLHEVAHIISQTMVSGFVLPKARLSVRPCECKTLSAYLIVNRLKVVLPSVVLDPTSSLSFIFSPYCFQAALLLSCGFIVYSHVKIFNETLRTINIITFLLLIVSRQCFCSPKVNCLFQSAFSLTLIYFSFPVAICWESCFSQLYCVCLLLSVLWGLSSENLSSRLILVLLTKVCGPFLHMSTSSFIANRFNAVLLWFCSLIVY